MLRFFTDDRREIISRTLFEGWKLAVPVVVAGGFWFEYDGNVRIFTATAVMVLFILAMLMFPAKSWERKA